MISPFPRCRHAGPNPPFRDGHASSTPRIQTTGTRDHVRSILVYPTAYRAEDVWEDEAGIVTEEFDEREGEAWEWGTILMEHHPGLYQVLSEYYNQHPAAWTLPTPPTGKRAETGRERRRRRREEERKGRKVKGRS